MMTAKEYRAHAEVMDKAMEATLSGAVIDDCRRMAKAWRTLALLADWQDAMLEKGHLPY